MQTWEYKTIELPFSRGWGTPALDSCELTDKLNQLGREGWELISIFTTHMENRRSGDLTAVLKRPSVPASKA